MDRRFTCKALLGLAAAGVTLRAWPAWPQGQPSAEAIADYQRKLAQYEEIHGAFERIGNAYWDSIAAKRRIRNAKHRTHEAIALDDYVLTQPPVYTGPPQPVSPFLPPPPPPVPPKPEIPVVADFLQAAKEQWDFVPDLPASDTEFKHAYAKAARAAGLTQAQIVGVYAFETGGNGAYNTQAGLGRPRPNARAISPAIGYNQLLSTNTVSLFGESGARFLMLLTQKENALTGEQRAAFERKFEILKRMIAYCRSLPHSWAKYDEIAKTTQRGWGIHAAVLDIDVGPLLQVQKLLELGAVRARQGLHNAAHRRRARTDESHRRRQRLRHGHHAAGHAPAGADLEFLPAARLCAQPGRQAHQGGGRPDRRDPGPHDRQRLHSGRAGNGGGVLDTSINLEICLDPS